MHGGGEMNGEKVTKQLEKDATAYKAGFADGYRVAKAQQILCKDCKYSYDGFWKYAFQRLFYEFTTEPEKYCAWAERKEE